MTEKLLLIKFPNLNSEIGQKGRWLGISSGSTVTNTKNILANQKYTISWMQKTDNLELAPYAGIYYKKTTDGTNNFWDGDPIFGYNTKLNTWEKISHTFTRNAEYVENSNSQALYIYGNLSKEGTCYVKDVQIEIGEKVTPYSIGERNLLNITDNSGFNNNATKVGTLTFNSDSPRYEGSTYFNGSALLNNSLGTVLANSKDFTISGWFNRTSGTCYYAGASSSTVPVCLENARFFIYSASGASKVGNWSCTNNVWQYLTLVHNSSAQTLTLYINGIQNQQITTDGTVYNRETLNIGGRNNGGQFVGSMSDFRIYATALSAEEILTLYKNSGIIDNNGNVYTREFKEV